MLLSRADTGRLALRATEFDLRKSLDGSLEDVRILGAGNNLQIETNVPETLPMKGDQEMISLTLQNLVENAVKYNRHGGKILVSAEKHDHLVQICVGNTDREFHRNAHHMFSSGSIAHEVTSRLRGTVSG